MRRYLGVPGEVTSLGQETDVLVEGQAAVDKGRGMSVAMWRRLAKLILETCLIKKCEPPYADIF